MTVIYPVIFTAVHDEKDTYLVYIPDINGMTEGYGLPDAYKMARDYIGGALYDKDDSELPVAQDISFIDIEQSPFSEDGESIISFVDVDLTSYRRTMDNKAVRRNVSIPNWLNKAAEEAHINVSRVLQEALMVKLDISN